MDADPIFEVRERKTHVPRLLTLLLVFSCVEGCCVTLGVGASLSISDGVCWCAGVLQVHVTVDVFRKYVHAGERCDLRY
jgi:hypothetical protein